MREKTKLNIFFFLINIKLSCLSTNTFLIRNIIRIEKIVDTRTDIWVN